jgi:intracellular septation protein
MKDLWHAARELLLDMAATLAFLLLYWLTGNTLVAVGAGLALAAVQVGWHVIKRKPMDTMQWVSIVLVVMSGVSALITNNPVFVLLKPSVIYVLTGAAMLKRGWMMRYMPADAVEWLSDMIIAFGYVWAGLMFVSAVVNLTVALNTSVLGWAAFMSIYSPASKLGLFALQYGLMKMVGIRRHRRSQARPAAAEAALIPQ